ncbi:hypothetical protein GCM10023321_81190 [Pseudonocardia eucalypti]|uniref:Uncharacterized protein n=1 Tax=Pseudonocardia eucalypti TaxID=648755 RepID=A0ABP9RCW0_9PSEU
MVVLGGQLGVRVPERGAVLRDAVLVEPGGHLGVVQLVRAVAQAFDAGRVVRVAALPVEQLPPQPLGLGQLLLQRVRLGLELVRLGLEPVRLGHPRVQLVFSGGARLGLVGEPFRLSSQVTGLGPG